MPNKLKIMMFVSVIFSILTIMFAFYSYFSSGELSKKALRQDAIIEQALEMCGGKVAQIDFENEPYFICYTEP